jgi:uncharacterized membrane protein
MIASAYSLYTLMLIGHVLSAVVWVGGGLCMSFVALQALRTSDPVAIAAAARTGGWLGHRIFTPASLLVFAFGVGMMLDGGLAWNQEWVLIALAAWLVAFLLGVAFFGPEGARIGRLAAERGIADPAVQARLRRVFLVSRLDAVLLVVVLVDMFLKPRGADLAWLIGVGTVLAVVAAFGDRLTRPVPLVVDDAEVEPARRGTIATGS